MTTTAGLEFWLFPDMDVRTIPVFFGFRLRGFGLGGGGGGRVLVLKINGYKKKLFKAQKSPQTPIKI
jgi:hypothetical protein